MNSQLLIVLIIMAAGAALLYFFWWKPKQAKKQAGIQKNCPNGYTGTTAPDICIPNEWGMQIDRSDGGWCVVEGVKSLSAEVKALIDSRVIAGLQSMIAATLAVYPEWNSKINTRQFSVCFIRSMATNMDGTPALLVGGIQSAGTVINVDTAGKQPRGTQLIVLPIPDDWLAENYAAYLEASVYNEGEHDIEYNHDLQVFLRYVGANDVHPHRAPVTALKSFYGGRRASQLCSGLNSMVKAGTVKIQGLRTA